MIGPSPHRLDELDRRILHTRMRDSHNTTASAIADQADVSGTAVRNRRQKLGPFGTIRGNTTHIDFGLAGVTTEEASQGGLTDSDTLAVSHVSIADTVGQGG
ncbi:hypothetical protein [Halogeometricum borinquense]|uniref:hypothetical protein n=1 Tax=Halogeometricum borinquense TaxID=60847 RepID=UPI0034490073